MAISISIGKLDSWIAKPNTWRQLFDGPGDIKSPIAKIAPVTDRVSNLHDIRKPATKQVGELVIRMSQRTIRQRISHAAHRPVMSACWIERGVTEVERRKD